MYRRAPEVETSCMGTGVSGSKTKEPARPAAIIPLLDYQREDVESDARFR